MTMQYMDTSNFNAQYDAASVRGLGGAARDPAGNHVYSDVSMLNAPYAHTIPFLEHGAGILTLGALGSLGGPTAGLSGYPWMEASDDTRELQEVLNDFLSDEGYCSISTDGKLGPATCGATRWAINEGLLDASSPPSACESYTSPRRPPCGGGSATPTPLPDLEDELVAPRRSSFDGDTLWLVGGALVAAVAIGAAIVMKKKGR